jgi:UDP-N-acetylmuramoyl-L-alanyl-D-glutamate--2,6-diaminopimelate ligase
MNIKLPLTYPVTCHTDFVGSASVFVAIQGFTENGIAYIPKAIERGARTIVIENTAQIPAEVQRQIEAFCITVVRVENARKTLAHMSAYVAENPAQKLKLFAVTGTKGKTTTASLLAHILQTAGHKTALLSTAGNIIDGVHFPATLTTPQPDYLHQFLKVAVQADVTHAVIEVAAHALSLHRLEEIEFDGIIFTNFAREHLEFYASMADYFAAKLGIFEHLKKSGVALVNGDDEWCTTITAPHLSFGMNSSCDMVGTLSATDSFLQGTLNIKNEVLQIKSSLHGIYNFYNSMAAVGLARLCGIDATSCQKALETFSGVPGRFEEYNCGNGIRCVIDSAHNPLSFKAILSTLRALTDNLIVVFGAGGQRDAGRRPLMGAIAAELSDQVIITTDNPRSEDPADIANQIKDGIAAVDHHKVHIELDRERAIHYAWNCARAGSIIALLGKGNERYQVVGKEKIPLCERTIISQLQ